MSKYNLHSLWNERYPGQIETVDYAGRRMVKSAIGNSNSRFSPTIDHIRPLSKGGKDCKENIIICNMETNQEKGDSFPNWNANDTRFQAKRVKGASNEYNIYELD